MNTEPIKQLVKEIGNGAFFVGKADDSKIHEIEIELGVKLPNCYKWFLKEYGHGGVTGTEIIGNGLAAIPACISATKDWRNFGLQNYLVVIEDEGTDWIICLDTSRMESDECPVVDWKQNCGIGKEYFKTFLVFFEERLREALSIIR